MGINTMTAEDPMTAVAIGTGKYVEFLSGYDEDDIEQELSRGLLNAGTSFDDLTVMFYFTEQEYYGKGTVYCKLGYDQRAEKS